VTVTEPNYSTRVDVAEEERIAVVSAIVDGRPGRPHVVIATTSEEGLGLTLRTLREEGQLDDVVIGILDRWGLGRDRWLVDPWDGFA